MSIREKILANRMDTLRAMRETAGYWFTWRAFYRWRFPSDFAEYPALAMIDPSEEVSIEVYPLAVRTLSVEVHAVHQVPDEIDDTRDRAAEVTSWMIADIERAMLQDVTCGGFAVDCRPISSEKDASPNISPEVGVVVRFEIDYRTDFEDPSKVR